MGATQPHTLPGSDRVLSQPFPLQSPPPSPQHLVSPPGSILPPSSFPTSRPLPVLVAAPQGLVLPLPHQPALPSWGPGALRSRRAHLGPADPFGARRAGTGRPGPALSSPQAPGLKQAAALRPLPGPAPLPSAPRARPRSAAPRARAPGAPHTHQGADQGPAPAPRSPGRRSASLPPARPSRDPAPRTPTRAPIAPFRRHAELSFFNWADCLSLKTGRAQPGRGRGSRRSPPGCRRPLKGAGCLARLGLRIWEKWDCHPSSGPPQMQEAAFPPHIPLLPETFLLAQPGPLMINQRF